MMISNTLFLLLMSAMAGMLVEGDQPSSRGDQVSVSSAPEVVKDAGPLALAETNGVPVTVADSRGPISELVRLAKAGVDEEIIIAYVEQFPRFFELDANDIIQLSEIGLSSDVIKAVLDHDKRLLLNAGIGPKEVSVVPGESVVAEVASSAETNPPEPSSDDFNKVLSPHGSWVEVDDYGRCWRPAVAVSDPDWQPYCDDGRWVYSSDGWYWMSDYPWGWATFHYGRWFRDSRYGWCWWPDSVWAPSWVFWRYGNSYCGWAPLPPRSFYRAGVGLVYRGSIVGSGYDFGLSVGTFTFVAVHDFCQPNPRRHRIARADADRVYRQTGGFHRIDLDASTHRIVNHGIPPQNIVKVTNDPIAPVPIQYTRSGKDLGNLVETLDSNKRIVLVDRSSILEPRLATPTTEMNRPASPSRTAVASEPVPASLTESVGRNVVSTRPVPSREPLQDNFITSTAPQKPRAAEVSRPSPAPSQPTVQSAPARQSTVAPSPQPTATPPRPVPSKPTVQRSTTPRPAAPAKPSVPARPARPAIE